MHGPNKSSDLIHDKICALRIELEKLLDKESMSSDNVLRLSMQLDRYITECYYRSHDYYNNSR